MNYIKNDFSEIKEIFKNQTRNEMFGQYPVNYDEFSLPTKEDNAWIQTYSGKKLNPFHPSKEDFEIEDIAHALSNLCRFTGHCSEFYSVATHSVYVSYMVSKEFALHGLLHDASEMALGDFSSPLKRSGHFENYKALENKFQSLVLEKFGLSPEEPAEVKEADLRMLATEARDLLSPIHPEWKLNYQPYPFKILPLLPKEGKIQFLERFKELTSK